ncbi:hypothetical protein EEB11_18120 [Pseudotabrizicola sediminis]|uniref:Chaperone modulatory protein CbpM n=1 Tax=Pseudotabrizicola sediminis TaxID=2486418 RepID=A0ABY2KGZ9_9RHOB|nr:hypothetical protein [Pseudotabrizicola sediminis]TGD41535.1 hypothetical protein EEB11_18120 [Pseudotabrizicola sediminis]TGD60383.1 hypothetical protein EYC08_20965 [Tabrizicola sp. WMC-M-20]
MTDHLTEDEVLAAIPRLTRTRLVAFVETELVIPLCRENEFGSPHVFRQIDCARMQLMCDLTDDLDLDEHALSVVLTLIDQLHDMRHDLLALARAVEAEPLDVRARIGSAIAKRLR